MIIAPCRIVSETAGVNGSSQLGGRNSDMKKLLSWLTIGVTAAGITAWAQDTAKDEAKKAGSDVKQAGKATGHAAKHTGKAVAKGTKKGVHKAAGATEKGASKVKQKTS